MYKGKKRRDSRHWWRRIQSRKYRRVLIIEAVLLVIVTSAVFLLAYLGSIHYGLCLLAWCLAVGIILIPLINSLRRTESKEPPQAKQISVGLPESKEGGASLKRPAGALNYPIEEIPPKNINEQSHQSKLNETS